MREYVYSLQEVKALEEQGYKLMSVSYFVNGTGKPLYIMAK